MKNYRSDLHIHSVLSPCGDLEMSPSNIVKKAAMEGLDVIAITDHNHTGHAKLARRLGEKVGIWVVYGVELTTREEVHCLAFFDTDEQLDHLQEEVDRVQPKMKNDTRLLGYQVIVDEDEQILSEISHSLYPGLNMNILDTERMVHALGGLFIPAHVDRRLNGLYAQLGIFPEGLKPDAVEISWRTNRLSELERHPELASHTLIQTSDAHFIQDLGRASCELRMESRNFMELSLALHGKEGREVKLA